jgi:hypothetical protein
VEENNTEWIMDRESPANPANHSDTFLEPFKPWKIECIGELCPISRSIKEAHAFDPNDCSANVYIVEDDCLTMHRLPIAQSTDAIRGKVGYETGMHVWKIHWPMGQRGTNAVIGVATKNHPLRSGGYTSLVGSVEGGYGWDICKFFALSVNFLLIFSEELLLQQWKRKGPLDLSRSAVRRGLHNSGRHLLHFGHG